MSPGVVTTAGYRGDTLAAVGQGCACGLSGCRRRPAIMLSLDFAKRCSQTPIKPRQVQLVN